ncbi:hypothetical protein BT96DRAFT_529475 [Gymnopus androsaceus JB14]|uniref:FAD-binding domain-containing protein n=1 Tax=Gymnopus androsaceus JB14 TaxID=1447944 RepID=A0A6A4IBR7_9AGAR|nr:hypothetical protein BT96DRAFT_529475 [Gymnopus androsaceus JB14]
MKKLPIPGDVEVERFNYIFLEDQPDKGRRMFSMVKLEGDQGAIRALVSELRPYKDPIPEWIFQSIDILEESKPAIKYSHVRVPGTAYIRYHRMANLPCNFVAIGDSVMSINPIFGQGCTKALLGAVALHTVLSTNSGEIPPNFSELFFQEHFEKTDGFWQTTRLIDYGLPSTTPLPGEDFSSGHLLRWYIRQLQILATQDAQAARAFWDGAEGFASPIDVLHPWLVIKVLWNAVVLGA